MEIFYNNKLLLNNSLLKPSETQTKPEVNYLLDDNKLHSLIMYDPDAPSGTVVHWFITNIKGNDINNGTIMLPYKGPAPPPKTGKHRYIFELHEQNENIDNFILSLKNRIASLSLIKKVLKFSKPEFKLQFISQNESGGKRIKTKNKKYNVTKKNKNKKYNKTKKQY